MKKILILILLLGSVYLTYGQSETDEKDGFNLPNGIRIGFQSSNLLHPDFDTDGTIDRGYIGYLRKMTIAHFIKIETGLEYMIAGAKLTEDSDLQLHYLCIPAEGLFKLGPFVAEAGVSGNFRISETYKEDGETIERSDDEKSNGFDFALNFGAGFSLAMFTLEVRHYWGLIDVQEDGWTNDYWQLGLKLNF